MRLGGELRLGRSGGRDKVMQVMQMMGRGRGGLTLDGGMKGGHGSKRCGGGCGSCWGVAIGEVMMRVRQGCDAYLSDAYGSWPVEPPGSGLSNMSP